MTHRIWSKVPAEVTRDKRLTLAAKVTFCELACWVRRNDNTVERGQRSIADAVGVTRKTVNEAMSQLAAAGHIRITGTGTTRRTYTLLSPIYRNEAFGEADGEVVGMRVNAEGVLVKRLARVRGKPAP